MSNYDANTVAALSGYLKAGRLSHAILIEGGDALKHAKALAKTVLCSGEARPCGACRDCVKVEKDIHPDLLYFSGGDRQRSFHVDAVREIRKEAYLRPNEAEAKVFILENAQNMTVQAQNALLKIIEEPPQGITFILTCDNKAALLDTVLSRVSSFSFGDVPGSGENRQDPAFMEKAAEIINALLSGEELAAMAVFSAYERDRGGFEQLLDAVRRKATDELLTLIRQGAKGTDETVRALMKIAGVADDLKTGLSQNAGGLIMTAMLPVRLQEASVTLRRMR